MSRLFGPLRQMGFVVRDIDKAMRHWVEVCGIGPWFVADKLPLDAFWYKEQRYDDIHLTIALANSGDVQLELIQQRDDKPSMYRDFLAAGHEGLQHWSSWPENYHELLDRAVNSGWAIGQRGETPRGPFVYFLNEGHPGTSSKWPSSRRPGAASSMRYAKRRSIGTGATRSAATGRAGELPRGGPDRADKFPVFPVEPGIFRFPPRKCGFLPKSAR